MNISRALIAAVLFLVLDAAIDKNFARAQKGSNFFLKKSENSGIVTVARVIKGDALILTDDRKVRLIGLSAPAAPRRKAPALDESGRMIPEDPNPIETIGEQSLNFTKGLLEERQVRLEFDVQNKDEDFYNLAYVYLLDGTFVNTEILRQGFADLKIVPPNMKYAEKLREAYREARREKRGLHAE